ncbi:MAG: glycosyltransferase family 2 protein [Candidatus Electrothrix sp. AX2]|nr:glycosyltransferase family 2 protein [Candidatus Electrothrix gigas]
MNNTKNPAVIIPCYKRIKTLERLLCSLLNAEYPENVPIVFSVDYSGENDVVDYIKNFDWPYGKKEIILHDKNIGLRKNILSCGALSRKFGSVIILEDDLYVSKQFYTYAIKTKEFYAKDRNVAGISLYAYEYSEIGSEKFYPLYNAQDTFLMQWASSWGQLWTYRQWQSFYEWYQKNKTEDLNIFNIPDNVINWPESSWKKYFIAYLVATEKFFIYPYISFVSNCGDIGVHCGENSFIQTQVPIPLNYNVLNMQYADSTLLVKYDSFFQIYPEHLKNSDEIQHIDFDVDLAGTKRRCNITRRYLLSSKKCRNPLFKFDKFNIPFALNIINDSKGDYFSIGKTDDFFYNENFLSKVFRCHVNREIVWSGRRSFDVVVYKLLKKMFSYFHR